MRKAFMVVGLLAVLALAACDLVPEVEPKEVPTASIICQNYGHYYVRHSGDTVLCQDTETGEKVSYSYKEIVREAVIEYTLDDSLES